VVEEYMTEVVASVMEVSLSAAFDRAYLLTVETESKSGLSRDSKCVNTTLVLKTYDRFQIAAILASCRCGLAHDSEPDDTVPVLPKKFLQRQSMLFRQSLILKLNPLVLDQHLDSDSEHPLDVVLAPGPYALGSERIFGFESSWISCGSFFFAKARLDHDGRDSLVRSLSELEILVFLWVLESDTGLDGFKYL